MIKFHRAVVLSLAVVIVIEDFLALVLDMAVKYLYLGQPEKFKKSMITEKNNIFCNEITIPEFTKEQIAECQKCKHASAKKIWCGHFGVWIREGDRIIIPSKKIVKPFPENEAQYNKGRFQRNYAAATYLCDGQEIVDEATFVGRRKACAMCPPDDKFECPCVGCKQWHKLALKKLKCPKGKW